MAAQDAVVATYDPSEVGAIVGHRAYAHPIRLAASTTYAKGQLLSLVPSSTTLTYGKYVRGATDGTEKAECILRWACVTDASGNITRAGAVGEYGASDVTTSAWYGGVFKTSDIPSSGANGLDAAAVTAMGGKLQRNGAELSF